MKKLLKPMLSLIALICVFCTLNISNTTYEVNEINYTRTTAADVIGKRVEVKGLGYNFRILSVSENGQVARLIYTSSAKNGVSYNATGAGSTATSFETSNLYNELRSLETEWKNSMNTAGSDMKGTRIDAPTKAELERFSSASWFYEIAGSNSYWTKTIAADNTKVYAVNGNSRKIEAVNATSTASVYPVLETLFCNLAASEFDVNDYIDTVNGEDPTPTPTPPTTPSTPSTPTDTPKVDTPQDNPEVVSVPSTAAAVPLTVLIVGLSLILIAIIVILGVTKTKKLQTK